MAVRPWKPKPLAITPMDTLERIRAGAYICTVGFNSIQAAEELNLARVRKSNQHPQRDFELSRLGWWGDRTVGHVGVIRIPLRLGRVALMSAGIAGVCVDPRARNQGIASVLLKDVLGASRQTGISFSMLFGIPDFYHRFGFVPAEPKHTVIFFTSTRRYMPAIPRWRARKAGRADLPRMMQLHEQVYGSTDGMAVRNCRMFFHRKRDARLILRGPGRGDLAYVMHRMTKVDGVEHLEVMEAAGSGRDWPAAVTDWAVGAAAKLDKDRLIFHLPAQHPICRQTLFSNAIEKVEHASNAAAMVCVLDFAGLARDMAPEWSARLTAAGVAISSSGLVVRFRGETYRWWPAQGRTERLAKTSGAVDAEFNDSLARLVMGYGDPNVVMSHYGMQASQKALPALRAMFAQRQLAFSPVDFF